MYCKLSELKAQSLIQSATPYDTTSMDRHRITQALQEMYHKYLNSGSQFCIPDPLRLIRFLDGTIHTLTSHWHLCNETNHMAVWWNMANLL